MCGGYSKKKTEKVCVKAKRKIENHHYNFRIREQRALTYFCENISFKIICVFVYL